MDIVTILEDAVSSLAVGDYTVGLSAIVRHVKAAIRHYERDQQHDPDTCTDAIYRTNQAYEGSLKEAYRVLAGKDPSGLTPHQIEQYLETHNVVKVHDVIEEDTVFDITISKGKSVFGIDARVSRHDSRFQEFIVPLVSPTFDENIVGVLMIVRQNGATEYKLYRGLFNSKDLFVIISNDTEQIDRLASSVENWAEVA